MKIAIALLMAQAVTTIQTSPPTYTQLGLAYEGNTYTLQAGQTIRLGTPLCTYPPSNGPVWYYYTTPVTATIMPGDPNAPVPINIDPCPGASKFVELQNPSTFTPVSNAYSCTLSCVYQTTVTDPLAMIRTYNSDEYVDTLLLQESFQWQTAKNALQNAINTGAGASAISSAKASLAAVELTLALSHGSLSSAPMNFKVIDGRFIWIMSGTPSTTPPQ